MGMRKRFSKYFIAQDVTPIPLHHYPMVTQKCNACGCDSAVGLDMAPDTNDPKKKRYISVRCAGCGAAWGSEERGKEEK